MGTPTHNSPEVLRDEILADARRESDQILRRAQEQAQAILGKATAEAEKVRRDWLDHASTEASRRKELILATVQLEAGRLRSARVEALLQSVCDEVRRRLLAREGLEYREVLVELAAEALSKMVGEAFLVKLSPGDYTEFGVGLAENISHRVGRSPLNISISADATGTGGGVLVQDTDGRQVWDNRLAARLERLWPELRRQIAVQTALVATSDAIRGEP